MQVRPPGLCHLGFTKAPALCAFLMYRIVFDGIVKAERKFPLPSAGEKPPRSGTLYQRLREAIAAPATPRRAVCGRLLLTATVSSHCFGQGYGKQHSESLCAVCFLSSLPRSRSRFTNNVTDNSALWLSDSEFKYFISVVLSAASALSCTEDLA